MIKTPSYGHRRSIRMGGHDYARGGTYFVTICVAGRAMLLGEVTDGSMCPSDAGRMVETTWHETIAQCASMRSDAFQLMPNHVHGLVVVTGVDGPAPSTSLPHFVSRFKSVTTLRYCEGVRARRWLPFRRRLWQRNYYEHLVRNDLSRDQIIQYIAANPSRWPLDPENPLSGQP
jgi:putative transposase